MRADRIHQLRLQRCGEGRDDQAAARFFGRALWPYVDVGVEAEILAARNAAVQAIEALEGRKRDWEIGDSKIGMVKCRAHRFLDVVVFLFQDFA